MSNKFYGYNSKKYRGLFVFCLFCLVFVFIVSNASFASILALPENFFACYSDIDTVNKSRSFGMLVSTSLETPQTSVSSQKQQEGTIVFKLFGVIPIRKVKVNILPEEEVYIGGVPIGIMLFTDGAVVISENMVNTLDGTTKTNDFFKKGDIICSINGKHIDSLKQISTLLQESDGHAKIEFLRNNKLHLADVDLLKTDEGYKLGLWVKDDISGIGTLTFAWQESQNFSAIGHPITDGKEGNIIPVTSGKIYDCSLIGITKGQRNNPGELRCVFMQADEKGSVSKNSQYGVFGHLDNLDNLVDANLTASLGGRLGVKPGKASIISSVSGIREEYEIEIIKANYQSSSCDKSIVFRVTDKRLLQLTGGIVQGMSGSPIMQNGKLIGAVTHVFLADPTKGYGVYSDWIVAAE